MENQEVKKEGSTKYILVALIMFVIGFVGGLYMTSNRSGLSNPFNRGLTTEQKMLLEMQAQQNAEYILNGGSVNSSVDNLYDQVAEREVEKYNMVKKTGNEIDACVYAGLVATAYLQAGDEANYNKWKKIEEKHKKNAGM